MDVVVLSYRRMPVVVAKLIVTVTQDPVGVEIDLNYDKEGAQEGKEGREEVVSETANRIVFNGVVREHASLLGVSFDVGSSDPCLRVAVLRSLTVHSNLRFLHGQVNRDNTDHPAILAKFRP